MVNSRQGFDTSRAGLAAVRDLAEQVLGQTRSSGASGVIQYIGDTGIGSGVLAGSTAIEEAASAIEVFQKRIEKYRAGGVTEEEARNITMLQQGQANLQALVTGLVETGGISVSEAEASIKGISSADTYTGKTFQFGVTGAAVAPEQSAADSAVVDLISKLSAAIEKQNALMETNNSLLIRQANATEQTAANTEQTAANTAPAAPDPNAVLQNVP